MFVKPIINKQIEKLESLIKKIDKDKTKKPKKNIK